MRHCDLFGCENTIEKLSRRNLWRLKIRWQTFLGAAWSIKTRNVSKETGSKTTYRGVCIAEINLVCRGLWCKPSLNLAPIDARDELYPLNSRRCDRFSRPTLASNMLPPKNRILHVHRGELRTSVIEIRRTVEDVERKFRGSSRINHWLGQECRLLLKFLRVLCISWF